jgi:hypothetical protein
MNILLKEEQVLILESNSDNWGCNLFETNTEQRDWCKCSMKRIEYKKSIIQDQINKVVDFMKEQTDLADRVKFYSESDPFFSENIKNLNELSNLLSNCENTESTIMDFKKDIAKKFLFVDKKENEVVYSLLNKLNTNYSALSYILTNFRERGGYKDKSFDDIFNLYFKPTYKYRGEDQEYYESKFFNLLVNYFSVTSKDHEQAKDIIDKTLKTIKGTSNIGKSTESEAIFYLENMFGKNNIKNFIGDYSWVDFLGVDVLINNSESGGWVPVQIKSNIRDCENNRRFCKNICIGKDKYRNWEIREYKGK